MIVDKVTSATAVITGAYRDAKVPQPLLRDRSTLRLPAAAIGAAMEAGSIGARTATTLRRVDAPGLDVDITACYPVAAALGATQDLLTHEVTAHHLRGAASLAGLTRRVEQIATLDLLTLPRVMRDLAFIAKARPDGHVLTTHVDLMGIEATITTPVVAGSKEIWVSGADLVIAAIEDLDTGGAGKSPTILEAWIFEIGSRLPGLRPVALPGGWIWDPRRASSYRSRDGRAWGNLYLLLSAMRLHAKTDPDLSPAERLRRGGMLKIASVAGAFGLHIATTVRVDVEPGTPHRVLTADGIVTLREGRAERPGPWAFPPAAAIVEGIGRLLLTLLIHEVRGRGGSFVQFDTDGGFILATPEGGWVQLGTTAIWALSFAQVQEVRDRFDALARWTGLPITSDRLEGRRLIRGEGSASLLKFAEPMVEDDGMLGEFSCYTPSLRRFAIHPIEGEGPWRCSENTIGVMVNPTDRSASAFAEACYRYLLATEAGGGFDADWLDEPVLWPKTITHPEDLQEAREAISDLRLAESVRHAGDLLGAHTYRAREVPGVSWRDLDWRDEKGNEVHPEPASESNIGGLRTWRMFLDTFLTHPVPFTLDEDGGRATRHTRGVLRPAPILIAGVARTGRTDWTKGTRSETLLEDPGEWTRILADLERIPGADLERDGLSPRTARALRAGRTPAARTRVRAREIVAKRARAGAGLEREHALTCLAPGCEERLGGRERSFCRTHASYPGSRRKAWKEAAGP